MTGSFFIMDGLRDVLRSVTDRDGGHDPVTGDTLAVCRADTGTLDRPKTMCIPLMPGSHGDIWDGIASMAEDWMSWCGRDPGYTRWMMATLMSLYPRRTDGMLMNALCMGAAHPMAGGVGVTMRMLGVLRGHDMYSRLMEHAPWPVEPVPLLASMPSASDDPAGAVDEAARMVGRARPALDAIGGTGPPPVMDAGTLRALSEGFTHGTGGRDMEDLVLSLHADHRLHGPAGITRPDAIVGDGRIGMDTERFIIRHCDWSVSDVDGALGLVAAAIRRGVTGDGALDWKRIRTSRADASVLLVRLLDGADPGRPGVGVPSARLAGALAGMGLPRPFEDDDGGGAGIPVLTADMTSAAARLLIEKGPLPERFVVEYANTTAGTGGGDVRMEEPSRPGGGGRRGILDLGPAAVSAGTGGRR